MKLKKPIIFSYTILIISLFVFTKACLDMVTFVQTPAVLTKTEYIIEKNIDIPAGATLNDIAKQLYQEKIITNIRKFKLLAYLRNKTKKIQAGEYRVSSYMTPNQILDVIISKETVLYKITIPEGYNLRQIANTLTNNNIVDENKFMYWATNKQFIKGKKINADSLEGYLFPETYFLTKNMNEKTVINIMVSCLKSKIKPEWKKRAKELNLSFHQILTLASIIEKETYINDEKKIISSVFHNRLKKKMRLRADPTVIYGIENFNGNITKKDLRKRHPYNTYVIKGLPPGPIASPGFYSIQAALYPSKTKYLYFVAKKNGRHKFSTNIKDHNRAVYKYQIRKRR